MTTRKDFDAAVESWAAGKRERLGGPPSSEEIAAYLRGDLSPEEHERVRTLLVLHPELNDFLKVRRRTWLPAFNIAATILIAILGVALYVRRDTPEEPRVLAPAHVLRARDERAPAPPLVLPRDVAVHRLIVDPPESPSYRIELIDVSEKEAKTVWRAERVRRNEGEPLEILLPRAFLEGRAYRLDVYGAYAERLESFRLQVPH